MRIDSPNLPSTPIRPRYCRRRLVTYLSQAQDCDDFAGGAAMLFEVSAALQPKVAQNKFSFMSSLFGVLKIWGP